MPLLDFKRNYFELFDLPQDFSVDQAELGVRYRQLQMELHPDRYASASAHEQRLAVQYSALVNEAYTTLRKPIDRALYLLKLAGMSSDTISGQPIDGGFLMTQMELREKLESIAELVDPQTALDHLITEIGADFAEQRSEYTKAYSAGELSAAARACVKMQYLEKLQLEAELLESSLFDK